MPRHIFATIFLLLVSLTSMADPRIQNPVFQPLSTKNGLPQDVVNDIVVDKEGFVWIATDGGVVRWDGVQTKIIDNSDGLFSNSSIWKLTVQEDKALFVSVYGRGVFRVDLESQAITQLPATPYKNYSEYNQHAESFYWQDDSHLILALSEKVQRLNVLTGVIEVLASLPDNMLNDSHSIRYAIIVEDILIVATTFGVFTRNTLDESSMLKPLDYLNGTQPDEDNQNAKFLMRDESDRIWISTVNGVFNTDQNSLIEQVLENKGSRFKEVLTGRNVWTMVQSDENAFWMGTNKGLFELKKTQDRWVNEHILQPNNGRSELSDKKISAIAQTEKGNLWLATVFAGALHFGIQSSDIYTIQNERKSGEDRLSDNVVWSFAQSSDGKLWIGTANGMSQYDFTTKSSTHFLREQVEDSLLGTSSVDRILTAPDNKLILEIYEGIRVFDPQTGALSVPPVSGGGDASVFNAWDSNPAISSNGVMFFTGPSDFYTYDFISETLTVLPLDPSIFDVKFDPSFLGESTYHNAMFLSTEGGVWLIDTTTYEPRLVYRFAEGERLSNQSVSSWVMDDTGVLWLAHTGRGLVGLDADTFEPLYTLDESNLLISNIVYGLQKDSTGNIWFSSHQGLHRYDPRSSKVQNFIYGRELSVSEFNQGASIILSDGRLAFGSTSGVVVFSPEQLEASDEGGTLVGKQTAITGVSVGKRTLPQGLKNLNGQHFDLAHDDFGLTIYFSSLITSGIGETKYYYKLLDGNRFVSEGVTEDAKITFANLDPGKYTFSVIPTPGSFESSYRAAQISLFVPYAPYRSPLAYAIYGVLLLCLLTTYLYSRHKSLTRLRAAQQQVSLFSDAFKQTRDWVIIFDEHRKLVAANPAFEHVFGFNHKEPLPKQLERLYLRYPGLSRQLSDRLTDMQGGDFWKDEGVIDGTDGKRYDVLIDITAISGNGHIPEHYLIVISDISEQKQAERKLLKIATYDSLTGLVNRTLLLDRLEHAIALARHHGHRVSVMFVDLDRFKGINDSLGHDYGDKLLRIVANRMRNLVADTGTVARLGGDEFVIVIEEVENDDDLSSFVGQVIEAVETPISLSSEVLRVSCSIGVAFYPDDAPEPADLIKQADVAMYTAKKDTLNGFAYFTNDMNEKAKNRLTLENKVKRAYSEDSFFNHYQPIINAKTKQTVGVELLLRGKLDGQPLYPDHFIPILEELRYIIEVTRKAMYRAAEDLSAWYKSGFAGFVSINLSALHFKTEFDLESVFSLLEQFDLPKKAFRFEITEGVLIDDTDNALRQIQRFVDAGFILALDDFGTGFSSLSYLKRYPLSVLKIDKSFVNEMAPGNANEALVATTISLANSLSMSCVAEGVETHEQAAALLDKGCVFHQGYHYARPAAAHDIPPLLTKNWH
ncbi:EAL domain-containing protein [Alteromonas sp. A081]|uniref:EAL domain-containing protein n=1 Tax=Alteromonas sp. A081 TaxID=3410269 RepID=UPI003B97D6BB